MLQLLYFMLQARQYSAVRCSEPSILKEVPVARLESCNLGVSVRTLVDYSAKGQYAIRGSRCVRLREANIRLLVTGAYPSVSSSLVGPDFLASLEYHRETQLTVRGQNLRHIAVIGAAYLSGAARCLTQCLPLRPMYCLLSAKRG